MSKLDLLALQNLKTILIDPNHPWKGGIEIDLGTLPIYSFEQAFQGFCRGEFAITCLKKHFPVSRLKIEVLDERTDARADFVLRRLTCMEDIACSLDELRTSRHGALSDVMTGCLEDLIALEHVKACLIGRKQTS